MMRKYTPWMLMLFFLAPILLITLLAFSGSWVYPSILPSFDSDRWMEFLGSSSLGIKPFLISTVLAVLVSLLSASIGFFTSYLLTGKARNWLLWLCLIPFCTAPVILAANFQYFFILLHLSASTVGVIIAQLFIGVPYTFLLFSTYWNEEQLTMDTAAKTLGATPFTRLLRVHFPAAKSLFTIAVIQLFLFSWFEYGMTQYIGVGQLKTLTVEVFKYTQEGNTTVAALASLLLILPPFIAILVIRKVRIAHA
ncbi:MAG: ABC transporter permease subunit [Flavobacteriales bacterium]|nr:ABC transporter permease subunit [Flavobacteriales bacterium]MDG1780768.1 ABC transporter permease subunit [Flavobacteriales bacterium]MDG2245493.1 ABC transporter permease subunit [Flavobacteriales bacterium]